LIGRPVGAQRVGSWGGAGGGSSGESEQRSDLRSKSSGRRALIRFHFVETEQRKRRGGTLGAN
jgi:hypothetical protein